MRVFGILLTIALLYRAGPTAWAGDTERDFGWQIADDGVLEYIIQISPQQAAQMQANKLENLSALPPTLVGRARRIAVRIGTDPLPRVPSLEEIERTIPRYTEPADVTAALGPGRIAEVEGGQVVDVQNSLPNLPPFSSGASARPSPGNGSFGLPSTSPSGTANPSASTPGASTSSAGLLPNLPPPSAGSAGSKFLDGASGSPAPNTPPPLYQPSSGVGYAAGGAGPTASQPNTGTTAPANQPAFSSSSKFADTATEPALPATSDVASGIPPQRTPVSGFGSTPGATAGPASATNPAGSQYGYPAGPSGYASTHAPNASPGYGSTPPTYGNSPWASASGTGMGGPDQGYDPRYASPGYNQAPPAGYQPQAPGPRMAALPDATPSAPQTGSPTAFPSTTPAPVPQTSSTAASNNVQQSGPSPSDGQPAASSARSQASASLVLLQMFFLISLLANVYLGFLMRKLLARYRNLLATVRGHATS
ncbi:MAG: hypothetical protein D6753_01700 [Planctomycetota bacterium]|nr:MAG: hypothetical protein D6753_01700 [Planctomycetota bacterium]